MSLSTTGLFLAFNELAAQTWFKLARSSARPTSFSETSLTDHNLFTLDYLFPQLNVFPFTVAQEARNGADWEWVVGSDLFGWITLRIQAKRIYHKGASARKYARLDHLASSASSVAAGPVAAHGGGPFQYDALIASCDPAKREFPLYVFYNGWTSSLFGAPWPPGARWLACEHRRCVQVGHPGCVGGPDVEWYGCAIAAATSVKAMHELHAPPFNREAERHLSVSLPWSYLWHHQVLPQGEWRGQIVATLIDLFGQFNDGDATPFLRALGEPLPQAGSDPPPWVQLVRSHTAADGTVEGAVDLVRLENVQPRARLGIITDLGLDGPVFDR